MVFLTSFLPARTLSVINSFLSDFLFYVFSAQFFLAPPYHLSPLFISFLVFSFGCFLSFFLPSTSGKASQEKGFHPARLKGSDLTPNQYPYPYPSTDQNDNANTKPKPLPINSNPNPKP